MEHQCCACNNSADWDEYFCTGHATAFGLINERERNKSYRYLLNLGGRIQAMLMDGLRVDGGPTVKALAIIHAPRIHLVNTRRLLYQIRLMDLIENVPGDIVECGVGTGESFINFCAIVLDRKQNRRLWGFDTFTGYPTQQPQDIGFGEEQKKIQDYVNPGMDTLPTLHRSLNVWGLSRDFCQSQVKLIKGEFAKTLPEYPGNKIALLHLDCNLYQSHKDCLKYLTEHISVNGLVVLDEYFNTWEWYKWPGAKQAIDEWLKDNPNFTLHQDEILGKYYLIKTHD